MRHATITPDGAVTGFYDDAIHQEIPAGAVSLTEEQYQAWAKAPTAQRWISDQLQAYTAVPSLTDVQAMVSAGLRAMCARALTNGFPSAGLGTIHSYPTDDVSQRNLTFAATLAMTPGAPSDWNASLWCADASGTWAFQPHTAAQVRQVAADWLTFRTSAQTRLTTLVAAVGAATSAADAEAVTW